jgi:HSP20 family protein
MSNEDFVCLDRFGTSSQSFSQTQEILRLQIIMLSSFRDFQRSVDRMFRDFERDIGDNWAGPGTSLPQIEGATSTPSGDTRLGLWTSPNFNNAMNMDIVEKDDHYAVHIDLPGVPKEQVKLNIENDFMTISAERQDERKQDTDNYHLRERRYGKMQRSMRIPPDANAQDIQAKFENGQLNILIPRTQKKSESMKTIEVQ